MTEAATCPVCDSQLSEITRAPEGRDVNKYICPLCGEFTLSRSLVATLPATRDKNPKASAKLSHALRMMQQANRGAEMYTNTVEEVLKRPLPKPKEQADILLRWIAENVDGPGETIWVEPSTHAAIIGAQTPAGFALVLRHLFDVGLVEGSLAEAIGAPGRAHVTPTLEGWDWYESLRRGGGTYHKVFMAMKFGDADLDNIVDTVFRVAVAQAGFQLMRLDDTPRAGLIDDRLRVEIQSSDLLISDLTHDNLGAYWEAGYAEGLGKPVIYTCEKKKFEADRTHFDTNHHLTIIWDKTAPSAAGEHLKATIRATLPELAKQQDD